MTDKPSRVLLVGNLNRPAYPSAPESFLTALSWRANGIDAESDDTRKLALVFRNNDESRKSTTVRFVETSPREARQAEWGIALKEVGVWVEDDPALLARAISHSLEGVGATKSRSQAATPLSRGTSLLQNLCGMTGKAGPADVGLILEQIFALGGAGSSICDHQSKSASQRCMSAFSKRSEIDSLVSTIDKGTGALLPGKIRAAATEFDAAFSLEFGGLLWGTPFTWFASAWEEITSDAWVCALPARVWSDWATMILRLGFGMTYLWEAAWFENLARQVVDGKASSWEELRKGMPQVLPWQPHTASVSVRDVTPLVKRRIQRADMIRALIGSWIDEFGPDEPLADCLREMRGDEALGSQLMHCLSVKPTAGKNTWEAVKFSLAIREESGKSADYYGLLRTTSRRFTVVDPAPEWIAVIAGLAAGGPGKVGTIQLVAASLLQLGIEPSTQELLRLLEAAGLARGSADADQAVLVEAAF